MTTKAYLATQPFWIDSAPLPKFPQLDRDEEVDVVIVGGGITGLTAAYLLTLEGRRVALLERERCAQIDTGHTTAHLTMVTDQVLSGWSSASAAITRRRHGKRGSPRSGRSTPSSASCSSTAISTGCRVICMRR